MVHNANNGLPQYYLNDTNFHGAERQHPLNTYQLLGAKSVQHQTENEPIGGNAAHSPHVVIAMQVIRDQIKKTKPFEERKEEKDAIKQVIVHELGHNILPEPYGGRMHNDDHTLTPRCLGRVNSFFWCPNHAKMVRKNVSKTWDFHDLRDWKQRESGTDSAD